MTKKRIYELAQELNTSSKKLIDKLEELGIEVKNHMSYLEEDQLKLLNSKIGVAKTPEKTSSTAKKVVKPVVKEQYRIVRKTITTSNTKWAAEPYNKTEDAQKKSKKRFIVQDDSSDLISGYTRTKKEYPTDVLKNKSAIKANEDSGRVKKIKKIVKVEEPPVVKKKKEEPAIRKIPKPVPVVEKVVVEEPIKVEKKVEPIKKPVVEQVKKEEVKNIVQPVIQPVIKPVVQPVIQPVIKPVIKPVVKPVVKAPVQGKQFTPRPQSNNMNNTQKPSGGNGFVRKPQFQQRSTPVFNRKPQDKPPVEKIKPTVQDRFAAKKPTQKFGAPNSAEKNRANKTPHVKPNKYRNQSFVVGQKKGVDEVLSEEFILNEFYTNDAALKRRRKKKNKNKYIPPREVLTYVTIPDIMTVKELAEIIKKTSTEVIGKLMGLGVMASMNEEIDFDTACLIADEFNIKAEKHLVVTDEDILFDDIEEDDEKDLKERPPVVVVMGHVDHGKTSLLDAIKKTNVIDSEAGGITQHIGAYMVKINGRDITFLDTPGHEAFTSMRARGAQITDIAILVISADDGIMPQTIEAINHAKAAKVSIIVAINKIDKPGANIEKVKQELTEYGLVSEEWGGDTICVPVSAKNGDNIDNLLEMVLLTADMLELKSNANKQAKGTVIEAKLDKNKGPIATLLIQRGTLKRGDSLITGTIVGNIRDMRDDKGRSIEIAGPSTPVEILGLPDVPEAGEVFYAIHDEKVAKHLAEVRLSQRQISQRKQTKAPVSLDDLFDRIQEGNIKELNLIVKADVQGSVEAVKQSLVKLSNEDVKINVIHGTVGAINESDVQLASVSNAIIIGFNVRPGVNVAEAAKEEGVDLRLYRVIYKAIEDVQHAMKGMLDPEFKEEVTGHAEIRQTFKASGIGTIAGCYVTDGKINRSSSVRLVRDGIVITEGELASLKRFKDDAKEVAMGYECGLSIEKFNDIKEGDVVEAFEMVEIER